MSSRAHRSHASCGSVPRLEPFPPFPFTYTIPSPQTPNCTTFLLLTFNPFTLSPIPSPHSPFPSPFPTEVRSADGLGARGAGVGRRGRGGGGVPRGGGAGGEERARRQRALRCRWVTSCRSISHDRSMSQSVVCWTRPRGLKFPRHLPNFLHPPKLHSLLPPNPPSFRRFRYSLCNNVQLSSFRTPSPLSAPLPSLPPTVFALFLPVNRAAVFRSMSLLDRYLAVWILLAMIIGVLLGYYVPAIRDAWETVSVANVSLPIAIGLWWMMYPVLCKVRFELLPKLSRSWGLLFHIGISLAINWVLAPLLMTGLAWATLPDQAGLRTGIILVGIARCIAMVLIWNHLAGGNAEFCAILVAVNSILQVPSRAPFAFSPPAIPYTICSSSPLLFPPQVILYSPLAIFYIGVVSHGGSVDVSCWTVAKSVLIFLICSYSSECFSSLIPPHR
ncbi:unnamed protein product [Closterium sp. NIES-53]